MKYSIKLIIFIILQLFAVQLFAEVAYEVQVVQTKNGSFWDMDVEIRSTGDPFVLSTSSFFLNFPTSPARFSTPARVDANDGPWDVNSDFDYTQMGFNSNSDYLGLTVEFQGGTDNTGQVVPSSWTRIGTLRLTITDESQSSGLTWRLIGTVTQVARLTSPGVSGGGSTSITALGTFNPPSNSLLPVELTSFTAKSVSDKAVSLSWQTKTEVDNYGFEVERKVGNGVSGEGVWEKIGFMPGYGNSNSPKDYSFVDKNPAGGSKFIYRLKQLDNTGTFEYSDQVEIELLPDNFTLYQNYPNPFNPETNIKFAVPKAGNMTLSVYNILGEKVRDLVTGFMDVGIHEISFDGKDLTNGTYIYRLQAESADGGFIQVKKMLLMK